MGKLKFSRKALTDLEDIWDYTVEKWSEKQAEKYYRFLLDACKEIAANPKAGRSYTQISPNLFGVNPGRHIVFYQLDEQGDTVVLRILHQQMDLKQRMGE
ncbi:MAG: type II toxin-antitoxin system RelE/ParE family toxin [Bacteroidetes bacterium]|nr:type II toxin-antitoxin system RelE/ParE family toxin [Bacteroidota bacterium]